MILLQLTNIRKHFGPVAVLDGASFEVRPGDKIGLVGPNGTGKSTLLNIAAGRLDADAGTIELHSSASVDYLEQQPQWESGRTLWQEAYSALEGLVELQQQAEAVAAQMAATDDATERERLGRRYDYLQHELTQHNAYHLDHRVQRVLDGLGFASSSHSQAVESLSGGQQNRLMLARLLLRDAEVLLLDEPSNHLDIQATEWLESYLADSSQALVVVSHDRYFLDKVTTRTLELYNGTVDDYAGNFSAYWGQKAERLKVQQRTFERQQEMIAKTEDFIRRNHYGMKHAQAEDRKKKLARVERVEPPRTIQSPPMGFPPAPRSGDIVLRVEGLSKAYAQPLFSELGFQVERGQRWAIVGANGSGKTTLLRCLVGQQPADDGRVIVGTGVLLGYYDQLLASLDERLPVVEAVRPPGRDLDEPGRRSLLARFGITGDAVFQSVSSLSGGERSRAALARLAGQHVNVLVIDEPTNHLDLWARDALEHALAEFDGTVLLVSHDRYFLNRVADHLLVFEGDGQVRQIEGNWDTYVDMLERRLAEQRGNGQRATPDSVGKSRPSRRGKSDKPEARRRKFPYRKVADLEQEIFERESRIEEVHALLAGEEVLRDGARVKQLQAELAQQQTALAALYEHWEEASELN